MVFQCINISQVLWEVLKTAAFGLGFQHLPRDLANVNAWKTMFDPYIITQSNSLNRLWVSGWSVALSVHESSRWGTFFLQNVTLFFFYFCIKIYFIVSGEISVYLVKIKVVSITSELISYHFTSDWYDLYFHSSLWATSVFFSVSEVDVTSTSDF